MVTEQSRDLAVIPSGGAELSVKELQNRVKVIHEVMRSVMKKGTHYDVIPGCKEPSLLKPGAEILAMTFRISVEIQIVEELVTDDHVSVRARAVAKDVGGNVLGSSEGACSTREKKYRWREPVHPKEFEAYPGDRKRITWSRNGTEIRQVRQEPGDLRNTIIQMASKRASVQVVRFICAASDIFIADPKDDRSEYDERGAESSGPVVRTAEGERAAGAGLRVVGMQSRDGANKDGEPYTLYTVTLSDGRKLTTFKGAIGQEADQAFRVGFAVKVQVSPGRKEGELRLDSIERAEASAS